MFDELLELVIAVGGGMWSELIGGSMIESRRKKMRFCSFFMIIIIAGHSLKISI